MRAWFLSNPAADERTAESHRQYRHDNQIFAMILPAAPTVKGCLTLNPDHTQDLVVKPFPSLVIRVIFPLLFVFAELVHMAAIRGRDFQPLVVAGTTAEVYK